MPNWVRNQVTITGSRASVDMLQEKVGASTQIPGRELVKTTNAEGKEIFSQNEDGSYIYKDVHHTDEDPGFSFWNIIRPEGEALETYAENWYDWNNSNWGCKWDAKDVETIDFSAGHWHVAFDTPWGSPMEVFQALSEQHPDVTIHVEWTEEQGFGAEEVYEDGRGIGLREWGVPESHEDYEEVFGEESCYCHYAGDKVEDYPYEDCPRPEGDTLTAVAQLEKISELI